MNIQAASLAALAPPVRASVAAAPRTVGREAPEAAAAVAPAAAPPAPSDFSSLLEVLTPEERDFFLFRAENSAFVYRPGGAGAPIDFMAPSLGRALDARG